MQWEEFLEYSHTWPDELFDLILPHVKGHPETDDVTEALSNNKASRHAAIIALAMSLGTSFSASAWMEAAEYVEGALKKELTARALGSVGTFGQALELLANTNAEADAVVRHLLLQGIRPTCAEVCSLLEDFDVSQIEKDLVAAAAGAFTYQQILTIGDCASSEAMEYAALRAIRDGASFSVSQIVTFANYGMPEDALEAIVASHVARSGGLSPKDIVSLADYVDDQTLAELVQVVKGQFTFAQATRLCELLYGNDLALLDTVNNTACSQERKLQLLQENGCDEPELFLGDIEPATISLQSRPSTLAEPPTEDEIRNAPSLLAHGDQRAIELLYKLDVLFGKR